MALDRTLFEISVKESDHGREYWLERPWLSDRRPEVQRADILIVPWEDFRDNEPALFPQGAADFVRRLAEYGSLSMELAIDEDRYHEILLHSKMHRVPTMLVTLLALPALAGMLGNLMTDLVKGSGNSDQVKMKLIVEGAHGRCIALEYEGPPERLADTLIKEADRCFPEQNADHAPATDSTPSAGETA